MSRFRNWPETPGTFAASRAAVRSARGLRLEAGRCADLVFALPWRAGVAHREAQVGVERVITDVEEIACLALVSAGPFEHEARVPARPRPQGVVAPEGR